MESKGSSRKGESFEWNFCGIENESKHPQYSPLFDIHGTNSTWQLSLTATRWQNFHYRIKLEIFKSYNSFNNVVNIITFANRFGNPICSEINISAPYKPEYEILFFARSSRIDSITVTCTFYQYSFARDISTQVSVDSFESPNNVNKKQKKNDSSENPSFLKCPIHLENLSTDFNEMLHKGAMTDIELRSGDVTIAAHRAVLMSRSRVFSSMFEHQMVESITGSIDIQDIKPSILHEFLKYLYSGQISDNLSVEAVFELYIASDKYEVKSLQEGCRNMLIKQLSEGNCFQILTLGEKHSDEQIKDAIANFISDRHEILKSDAWIEFTDNFPKVAARVFQKYISNCPNK